MSPFTLDVIVRASALLAVAAVADLGLRRRASAATRHLVWTLAIGALLALPVAAFVLPQWTVPIPIARRAAPHVASTGTAPSNAVVAPGASARAVPVPCLEDGGRCEPDTGPAAASAPPRLTPRAALTALYFVYAAGLVLLLMRLAVEPLALRRLTRASREVNDAGWRRLCDSAAAQLHVSRTVRLLRSERDVMPLTFGTAAPTIVLPASADEWGDDRRRAVLLHELAHVARRDCLVQRIAAFACAFYWPHPGVWWAARRLRTERELACDDRVLASGAAARDYAGHLLDIAHTFRAAPAPATALGMARARQLERRLLAILDEARNRTALGPVRGSFLVAVAIAVFLPMAGVRAALMPIDPASPAPLPGSGGQEQEFTGTWDVHLLRESGRVQLNVRRGRAMYGTTLALADVERVAGTTLAAASTVHFPIRREAGTFTIDGTCRNSACAGTYVFEPSATFGAELAKRGIGRPTPQDQFHLAIADIGIAYLDTLTAAGYAMPDLPTLVNAAKHGVDAAYVRDMGALGYRLGTVDALIRLRDHGVDPEYVRGMASHGLAKLSADEIVRARDHGVDPNYVAGLAALGFRGLGLDALVAARDHGVDPEYIRGMQGLGHKLTIDEFTRMRDHGVDPEYVRAMAQLGYNGIPADSLIRLRDHGVDPSYVRRLQQRGLSNLSVDEIIRRRDRGDDR